MAHGRSSSCGQGLTRSQESVEEMVRREIEEEEDRRRVIAHVLQDLAEAGASKNLSAIARKNGLHPMTVSRIAKGTACLDGKAGGGRRPYLSQAAEARVVLLAQKFYQEGLVLRFGDFQTFARMQWEQENPNSSKAIPKFERKWFDGFRQRHPQLPLIADHVTPQTNKRFNHSERSFVNEACQKLKRQFHKLPGNHDGWVEAYRVMFADETDVSLNGESPGTRGYNPLNNSQKPRMVSPKSDSPHISCTPFASLDGRLIASVFVIAGNPSTDASLVTLRPTNPIIFNESGSSEVDSADGKQGSWSLIIDTFLENLHAKVTVNQERPCLLILDGLAAHCQPNVVKKLHDSGVRQFVLDANLTHLIQMQDTQEIFGALKGSLRRAQNESCNLNGNQLLPLELRCAEIEKYVAPAHSWQHVRRAAQMIGFVFKEENGVTWVTMTDKSISTFLDHLEFTGAIHQSRHTSIGHDLRDQEYVKLRQLKEILGADHADLGRLLPQSEEQFRAQQRESAVLLSSRMAQAGSKRPNRIPLKRMLADITNNRAGTYTVDDATAVEATLKRLKNELKHAKSMQNTRRRAREARRKASLLKHAVRLAVTVPSDHASKAKVQKPLLEQSPLFFDPFKPIQH